MELNSTQNINSSMVAVTFPYIAVEPTGNSPSSLNSNIFSSLSRSMTPQMLMILIGAAGAFILLTILGGKSGGAKGKLAKGYFGGNSPLSSIGTEMYAKAVFFTQ